MADYTLPRNFEDLVTDLIKQRTDTGAPSAQNFSGEFYNNLSTSIPNFWAELVDYLNQEGTIGIQSNPIKEATFNYTNIESVFKYIADRCDLNSIWDELKNSIKDHIDLDTESGVEAEYKNYFWNESMNKAVATFLKTMDSEIAKITLGEVEIPVKDIKNADAGWSFINTWVKPTINIDNDSYETVRGVDKILSVLKNKDQLQFTNNQNKADGVDANSWIRLLMPKYLRKVEVEDLNRNFWVIAQTLSAICSYLFGNNSLGDQFKNILNELIQLWENVLYLWAGLAMISQKDKITDYQVIIVPVANSPEQGYIKFDNFGTTDQDCYNNNVADWSVIEARVKHIKDQYNNVNLIIIPEIREGNYKHNYYYRVSYPGMLIYDRNNATEQTVNFVVPSGQEIVTGITYPIVDLNYESNLDELSYNYLDKIGAILETEANYKYCYPYSNIINSNSSSDPPEPSDIEPYYAMLRMIPNFDIDYDSDSGFTITSLEFQFNDVSQELKEFPDTNTIITYTATQPISNNELTFGCSITQNSGQPVDPPAESPINKGYYLGELVSYQSILGLPVIEMESQPYFGQQLFVTGSQQAKDLMAGD